jgi:hypothetical protein
MQGSLARGRQAAGNEILTCLGAQAAQQRIESAVTVIIFDAIAGAPAYAFPETATCPRSIPAGRPSFGGSVTVQLPVDVSLPVAARHLGSAGLERTIAFMTPTFQNNSRMRRRLSAPYLSPR